MNPVISIIRFLCCLLQIRRLQSPETGSLFVLMDSELVQPFRCSSKILVRLQIRFSYHDFAFLLLGVLINFVTTE